MNPFVILSATLFFGWIGWSVIPSDPHVRLDRACLPVSVVGSFMVAVTELTVPTITREVSESMDEMDYGCEYALWRTFYGKEYAKALNERETEGAGKENGKKSATKPIPAEKAKYQ